MDEMRKKIKLSHHQVSYTVSHFLCFHQLYKKQTKDDISLSLTLCRAGAKGTFHAKMGTGTIKDTNGRWQEYTEENIHKKDLHDPGNHDGVITHLEPDILECEVKWALESITMNKASESDEIPVELFQILKDDAVKVLHSVCQQIWKTQQWPQDWKRSVFIPIPKKGNAKECSNNCAHLTC